jgi:hypothetical protein
MKLIDNPRVDQVNTTNYRIVITMRIIVGAMVVTFGTFVFEVIREHHDMAETILESSLFALVVLAGVDAAQFAAKRFSNIDYKAAGQPPQVITTEGGPLTAQAGSTLQSQPEQPEKPPAMGGA